jgi:hypothetical protein
MAEMQQPIATLTAKGNDPSVVGIANVAPAPRCMVITTGLKGVEHGKVGSETSRNTDVYGIRSKRISKR